MAYYHAKGAYFINDSYAIVAYHQPKAAFLS